MAATVGASFVLRVSAQRYPPFPIGGSDPAGTGGTGTGTGTGSRNPAAGSEPEFFPNPGVGGAGGPGPARSGGSNDGESMCDLAHCLHYAGLVGDGFVVGQAQQQGVVRVAALEGCCDAGARIDVYIESERVHLGTITANDDGSYFGQFTLPASIGPGEHTIMADIEGCGQLRGAFDIVDGGATVLGTTVTNSSGSAGPAGILPRTGGDVMRVLLWALVLIGFGLVLVVVTRRLSPAGADDALQPGGAIAALPPPEVPFVDTSRFEPYRSAPGQRLTARRSRPPQRSRRTTAWDRAPRNEPKR